MRCTLSRKLCLSLSLVLNDPNHEVSSATFSIDTSPRVISVEVSLLMVAASLSVTLEGGTEQGEHDLQARVGLGGAQVGGQPGHELDDWAKILRAWHRMSTNPTVTPMKECVGGGTSNEKTAAQTSRAPSSGMRMTFSSSTIFWNVGRTLGSLSQHAVACTKTCMVLRNGRQGNRCVVLVAVRTLHERGQSRRTRGRNLGAHAGAYGVPDLLPGHVLVVGRIAREELVEHCVFGKDKAPNPVISWVVHIRGAKPNAPIEKE